MVTWLVKFIVTGIVIVAWGVAINSAAVRASATGYARDRSGILHHRRPPYFGTVLLYFVNDSASKGWFTNSTVRNALYIVGHLIVEVIALYYAQSLMPL